MQYLHILLRVFLKINVFRFILISFQQVVLLNMLLLCNKFIIINLLTYNRS
jgi:hypothetical protein